MSNYFDSDDAANRLRDDLTGLYNLPEEDDDLASDIADIEALVNSYVGKRYETPVTDSTAISILKKLCLDLFAETAYMRTPGDELPKKVKDAADIARKQLKEISTGAITLAGATSLTERPSGGADAIIVDGNDPEFTRDDMEGF